ncbi:MAG: mono/diheme cytochrome c family protein, partial [Cyclobacteriaceae bacterium]
MKKRIWQPTALIILGISLLGANLIEWGNPSLFNELSLNHVLQTLGDPAPIHEMDWDQKQIEIGKELVETGQAVLADGKKSKPISKYFVCTNCHNSEREEMDIRFSDPDTRLPYAIEHGIPFLQGTTFWGIVNRESWYNDDYFLKYGEGVRAANSSLRESIQLCAIECSQGRPLEKWEEDAILAYYWTLELKMADLEIPESIKLRVTNALKDEITDTTLVNELKGYYMTASPATFGHVLENKKEGYGMKGDVIIGEQIYETSCRYCHQEGGVSDFLLDYAPKTFKYLKKHMFQNDDDFSIYQIIRKGTYASPGARPYMPHYPEEKMSDTQIESLRLYVLAKAD